MRPLLPKIGQISMIVDDALAYAKRYNDEFGIGPWHFLLFDESNMTGMTVHGKPVKYAMKIALCNMFDTELELIEPMDDKSAYAEFLKEHGPGLHHLAFVTPNNTYRETYRELQSRNNEMIQGGTDPGGQDFAYFDLTKELGMIIELNDRPDDFHPLPPEDTYPPKQ
jgi:methylmalonyl-CoA/ethylmalonyl-CoA epimerase